ncbi:winged helix-turn-helix domain-containing protein [Streptomyces sp. NPDC048479]|uniref:winged helix-turn-helix domain-containing protein n=1 Tax=Streptomyces sp. NPDC048479 TaxID=3154725 RepID=UPI003417ADDE
MTVAAHDPRPKKVQISDALRTEITTAPLPSGHRLASLRDLAERFEVTTVTIGNALQILMDEGLVTSVPTRGYFVQTPPADTVEATGAVERDEINAIHSEIRRLAARVAELEKRVDHEGSA